MKLFRSTVTIACLGALVATSLAQAQGLGLRPSGGTGITDIMRGGPRVNATTPGPAVPVAPAAPTGQRAAEYIVALVNSEPITNTEVQKRAARILQQNPDAQRVPRAELNRLVLERLISERAQLQVAKEAGIKVDDLAIDQAEQLVARQNQVSLEDLYRRIAAEGVSKQEFRADLRDQLTLTRVREREVNSRVKVSDTEVEQFLQEQRSGNAAVSPELNLAHVLVAVPEDASEAQARRCSRRPRAWPSAPSAARTSPRWRARTPIRPTVPMVACSACARPTAIRRCSSRRPRRHRSTASSARCARVPDSM